MRQLIIDFETMYDKDFSLSKMQTDAYILDPRFEIIGVSVKDGDKPAVWFSGDHASTAMWLGQFDINNSAVICHHAQFDGFILQHVLGFRPKHYICTLSMGRRFLPWLPSHSLANMAKHFKLQAKGDAVHNAMGMRRKDFNPAGLAAYGEYCCNDVDLTYALNERFLPRMTPLELYLVDMTIRMFTEPGFIGDAILLQKLHQGEIDRKAALLVHWGGDKADLMSNPKLAEKLRGLGVEPPTKISARTGKEAFAFAKSDKEFVALTEHPDDRVATLVQCRLGVKTTIAETRALKFLEAANRGPMPVYLHYWGAKTTGRYSGGNKNNYQNLSARGPSAGIRGALCAPPGHAIMAGDSSNIELRVAMCAAGQWDVVEKIKDGIDLYCDFATKLFSRTVTKADKMERMLGKVAMLSLQYGAGWEKFKEMVRLQTGIILPDDEAQRIVRLYRHVHHKVMDLGERFTDVLLPDIAAGCDLLPVDVNAWALTANGGFGVAGEQGVVYHNLRQEAGVRNGRPELQWVYTMGRETVKIYSGKCVDGNALVLTELGWKRLKDVGPERVHDGVDFVSHAGISFNGYKQCIAVDGVLMTPDHEVLTDEGWKTALENPRPYRPDIRDADYATTGPRRWQEDALVVSVRVREDLCEGGIRRSEGSETGGNPKLRMRDQQAAVGEANWARHEQTSGLLGVAEYEGSVSPAYAPSVEELRGEGHTRVLGVGPKVRGVLGGYGANIPTRPYTGSAGQREGVQQRELRLADSEATVPKQTEQYRSGPSDYVRRDGHTEVHAVLQADARAAASEVAVFDIVNCGPQHRYVVMGENGPFIVHNCVENLCQYLARMIVLWQTARIHKEYPVKLSVHDEAVIIVPKNKIADAKAYMEECLSMAPPWCRGQIPLACEVSYGANYSSCK